MKTQNLMTWLMALALIAGAPAGQAAAGEAGAKESKSGGQAIASLEAAAAASPQDAGIQAELSRAYATAGRAQDAFLAIQKAVLLAPDNLAYHAARIPLANWAGKMDAAAESAERILAKSADDRSAMLALARIRKWQGHLGASSAVYAKYVGKNPDDAAALIEFAQVKAWQGDMAEAIRILDKYEKRFGKDAEAGRARARVLASAERPDESLKVLAAQPADQKKVFEDTFTKALALYYDHDYKKAQDALAVLDSTRPGNPEAIGLRNFIEAPRRSDVRVRGNTYGDSDHLRISNAGADLDLSVSPATRVGASYTWTRLDARSGSGLEDLDGGTAENLRKYQVGVDYTIVPSLSLVAQAGGVLSDDHNAFVGQAGLNLSPTDGLMIKASGERDLVLISPRTVSLDIERKGGALDVSWQPDLLYTLVGFGRFDDFTDGNARSELILAPRRSVLRSQYLNVDLGVRAWWLRFDQRLNNGYYSPEDYKQYSGTVFAYAKLGPSSGLGLIGAVGYYEDETMDKYDFGWSLDAELTVGAFSDWMLKISGAIMQNLRSQSDGAFDANSVGMSVTQRF